MLMVPTGRSAGVNSAEVEQFGVPIDEHVLTLDLRGHLRSAEVGLTG
jgi:hypothetical protein